MASLSLKSVVLAAWSWSREGQLHSDHVSITLTSLFVVISFLMWYAWMKKTALKYPLPPGPRGLPLVGNLPFIDRDIYRYFAKMTKMYGPIFKLKMGSKLYVVVGSTSYAKEVLKDCDTIFANRDTPSAIVTLSYGGSGLIWTSYGSHWRTLRMICAQHILNKASLDALYILRRRQLRQTVKFLYSKIGSPVDIADQMFFTSLNTITSMLWGGTVKDDKMSSAGKEFQQAIIEAIALMGEPNISDLFPLLARFDIQGIAHRAQTLFLWFDRILDSIINERIKFNQAGEKNERIKFNQAGEKNENSDFLDILLELKDRGDTKIPVTIANIKALFLDLVVAATDTTATTVEWAMAEIINHPEIMKRIQEELVTVVGENGMVEESHIHQLTYLEAVIKETFRFHSVVPFLVPRRPSKSCIIGGYTIPKGTQILVNARALQSDPEVWENPLEFQPERFLKNIVKWDYSGNNFNFLPFGSGRRMCAGSSLVERTVPYALASLLHSFNWRLAEGVALDFSDKMTLTLKKMTPLIAIPTPRLSNPELYL